MDQASNQLLTLLLSQSSDHFKQMVQQRFPSVVTLFFDYSNSVIMIADIFP